MSGAFTTGELVNMRLISSARVDAAVDAYMLESKVEPFTLGDGYVLDLDAAVRSNPFAARVVMSPEASEPLKREAVCRAILTARPAKM